MKNSKEKVVTVKVNFTHEQFERVQELANFQNRSVEDYILTTSVKTGLTPATVVHMQNAVNDACEILGPDSDKAIVLQDKMMEIWKSL